MPKEHPLIGADLIEIHELLTEMGADCRENFDILD